MKNGFYLKKFEILNWGTFDSEIETYYLNDDVTVVSGDNGSGKSTVVDAFVSLIVPNIKRKYNLSATDGSKKKSRSEATYIKGAYKNEETDRGIQTVFLRGNDKESSPYSVILGYFKDEGNGKELTLATFFRLTQSDTVDKFFVVSEQELFIKNDFVNILNKPDLSSPISKLRASLKTKTGTRIYDKFGEYQEDFSRVFGLRSNAIELFNKVVSLKEIKDLNSFFRENMLENNPEILNEFEEVEKNYIGVKDIYEKIILSEEKLKILGPFVEYKKDYENKKDELKKILFFEENINFFSDEIERKLIEKILGEKEQSLEINAIEFAKIKELIAETTKDQREVENLIENSEFAKRLRQLQESLEENKKQKNIRENNFTAYGQYLSVLGLNSSMENLSPDERGNLFKENSVFIEEKREKLEDDKTQNQENIVENMSKKKEFSDKREEAVNELLYFKNRANLLPKRLSDIRQTICKSLGIDESELSFVCELVKVKESEKPWEMAIEKLLHSFGQDLLVPENLLERVNNFVNKNNLKNKLSYNKIPFEIDDFVNTNSENEENFVISKIEIKHNSKFEKWIRASINRRFNYLCLESTDDKDYYKSPKVLTISGLIKTKNVYIKDDRLFRSKDYILGWNNINKILELEKEVKELEKKQEKIEHKILKLKKAEKDFDTIFKVLIKLESIKVFSEIDFFSILGQIKNIQDEIIELENSNTDIKRYTNRLRILKENVEKQEEKKDNISKEIGVIENDIKKLNFKKQRIEKSLQKIDIGNILKEFDNSKYGFKAENLEEINTKKDEKQGMLRRKKDKINEIIQTLVNKMNGLASSYREHKMTDGEKLELSSNISVEDLREYLEKEFHKINDEQLYSYREKFEKEFRETLFIRLNDFYMSLENEETYIKEKISQINETLKTVPYSKDTFIEIAIKENKKKVDGIEDFKRDFREKVLNKRELDMDDKMKAFENIKSLMEKLISKDLEKWRDNVIDVRNWFLFSIKEKFLATGLVKDVYESSSGKSGGQTIKLAYGVLSAALMYQYGIKEENVNLLNSKFSKSFRLVVIDEVFAKLDIDNSRYVLDLFKRLDLQLFIITPTNTINVLEDYVETIYFVSNNSGQKSFKNKIDIISRVPIEEKIKEKKEAVVENKFLKKESEKIRGGLEEMRGSL